MGVAGCGLRIGVCFHVWCLSCHFFCFSMTRWVGQWLSNRISTDYSTSRRLVGPPQAGSLRHPLSDFAFSLEVAADSNVLLIGCDRLPFCSFFTWPWR